MNKNRLGIIILSGLVLIILTWIISSYSLGKDKVQDYTNINVQGITTSTFQNQVPPIIITYPKGGEQLQSGKTYKIFWTGGVGQLGVSLAFRASPVEESPYNDLTLTKSSGVIKNTGSYNLTIPIEASGSYVISILDEKNNRTISNPFNVVLTRNPNPNLWIKNTLPTFSDFPTTIYQAALTPC